MDFKQFAKKGKKVLKSATVFMMVVLIGTTTLVQAYATYAGFKVEHVWADNSDVDGKRPDVIEHTVIRDNRGKGTQNDIAQEKLDTPVGEKKTDEPAEPDETPVSSEPEAAASSAPEAAAPSAPEAAAPSAPEAAAPSAPEAAAPSAPEAAAPSAPEAAAPSAPEAAAPSAPEAAAPSAPEAAAPSAPEAAAPPTSEAETLSAPVIQEVSVDTNVAQRVAEEIMKLDEESGQEIGDQLDSALKNAIKDLVGNNSTPEKSFETVRDYFQPSGNEESDSLQQWSVSGGGSILTNDPNIDPGGGTANRTGITISGGGALGACTGYMDYAYERDDEGNLILDDEGKPIAIAYDPAKHGNADHHDGKLVAPMNYSAELSDDSKTALKDAGYETRLKITVQVVDTKNSDGAWKHESDESDVRVFVSYDEGKTWIGENPEDTYDPDHDFVVYTTYTYLHLRPASYGITPDPEEPKPEEPKPEEPKPEEPKPEEPKPEEPKPEEPKPEEPKPEEPKPEEPKPEEPKPEEPKPEEPKPEETRPERPTPERPTPEAEIPSEDVPLAEIPEEDVPLAEIPEEDVPLAEIPEEDVPLTEIPEENVPLSEIPKTGDHSVLWLCAALASGAALLFVTRRKETV